MVRKLNKGVTIVEVLIALAIFLVMMIPLVSGLVAGMKTSTSGKELQYRNEYAQNLMENVKEVSVDVLKKQDIAYFKNMGAENVTISEHAGKTGYQIVGTTYLGTEHTPYMYVVDMDRAAYADVNKLTSGVVENLDKTRTALISARFANYDTPAYEALLSLKMAELRKYKEKNNQVYNPITDVQVFDNDTGNRNINIVVSGSKTSGYDVACTVYYSDNCDKPSATAGKPTISDAVGNIEYDIYKEHFTVMPNIYLMYNVCVYNKTYANEYITYDLSGLADEGEDVNVFVVETAERYSKDVTDAVSDADVGGDPSWIAYEKDDDGNLKRDGEGNIVGFDLYKNALSGKRDGITIGMAVSSTSLTDTKKEHFHVYHNMIAPDRDNFDSDEEYDAAVAAWNSHKKNTTVSYSDAIASEVRSKFNTAVHENLEGHVEGMDKAQKDNRGLYKVTVWMQEVPRGGSLDVATLKANVPILQGTRGGGEID